MKKQIIFIIAIILGIALASCYDDKSSLDTRELPEVIIDATNAYASGTIHAGYMEDLSIVPKIMKAGREDHPDLSYRWTLTVMTTGSYSREYEVISEEKDLNYVIQRAITPVPYKLWLTVTDNENTMEYLFSWDLYVESSFGEGLLVAYTRDGTTSDFALVMDSRISPGYEKETFIRDGLYEAANGAPIPVLIKYINYGTSEYRTNAYQNMIRATTTDGILYVNCMDYSRMDDEMVYIPGNFAPDKFVKAQQSILLNAGAAGIYVMTTPNDKKPVMPSLVPDNGGVADLKISNDSHQSGAFPNAIWYHNGKFYFYNGFLGMPPIGAFDNTSITAAFDPTNLPGQECQAAGLSTDKETHTFLLKDIASGNYAIYTFAREVNNDPDPNTPAQAKARIAIPASLNSLLDAAVSIFFIADYAVMYVATANTITPIIFAGGVVTAGTAYNVPSGETLTMAKLFQEGVYADNRYMFDDPVYATLTPQPLTNRAVCFVTSTGAYENNAYIVPMITNLVSSGTLNTNASRTLKFTGFGKILDFTMQGK